MPRSKANKMIYPVMRSRLMETLLPAILLSLASCHVDKPQGYFAKGMDTTFVDSVRHSELPIQKGDVLFITFYSDNPEATAIYNQVSGVPAGSPVSSTRENVRGSSSVGAQANSGYKVDKDGHIRIHGLGTVRAEGLTRSGLERNLTDRITTLGVLSNPYCIVQYAGIRITVLGEVRAPGVYQSQSEQITVFDALGLAGDILPSGRKEEVLLIREEEGRRSYARVDLTAQGVFQSPHLYLQQNDLVVVQANSLQLSSLQSARQQMVGMAVSIASILVLLLNMIIN